MAVTITEISLDVNSDPSDGAENVDALGAQFDINLEQPIFIPGGAFNATVRVEEATVWNTVNNVAAGLNNNHIFITDDGVTLDVTIPDGNYSTSSLSSAIDREYVTLGGTSTLVTLDEDFATQRVLINVLGTLAGPGGAFVDWTAARTNTFRDVVGVDPTVGPGFGLIPRTVPERVLDTITLADEVAKFNNIEYFKIHADIGQGIRTNDSYRQTIARVNITVPPGSQIVSEPQNPAKSEMQRWIGNPRKEIRFWLTNEKDELVETGEIWSARLVFAYSQFLLPPASGQRAHSQAFAPEFFRGNRERTGTT